MYKSFKFVLFNESILAGAGYQPDLQKRRISAGAGAGAELRYSPIINTSMASQDVENKTTVNAVHYSNVQSTIPYSIVQ